MARTTGRRKREPKESAPEGASHWERSGRGPGVVDRLYPLQRRNCAGGEGRGLGMGGPEALYNP
jgi:hypothetical protein